MVFWISVLFVCAGGECSFAQGEKKYFNAAECREVTEHAVASIKEQGAQAAGVCIPVSIKDIV